MTEQWSPTRFAGKTALVTGAASPRGIGYATARRLAAEGACVVLTDVDGAGVERSAAALRADGAQCLAFAQDVGNDPEWSAILEKVTEQFGGLDILVNNAGRAMLRPLDGLCAADISAMVQTNLTGVMLGARAALAHWRGSGRKGAIVNVASVAGVVGVNGMAVYSATKGGVRLFTKALALEAAPLGIRCNTVFPGMVDTDFFHATALGDPEASKAIAAAIPLGRLAAPDEIASCIAWLASNEASYVTGADFVVDGGYSAQ